MVDLDLLSVGALDELGYLLQEEARRRRRTLDDPAAWGAFEAAEELLTDGWRSSSLKDVGKVRTACRRLIVEGWRAEQIIDAMTRIALHTCPEAGVAHLAVAEGIVDGEMVLVIHGRAA